MTKKIWSITNQELQEDCGELIGDFELSYFAKESDSDRTPDLTTIFGEVKLTLKLWQIPLQLVWLNADTNPFEKIVDVGKEITDSLFTVIGHATQIGEVVKYDDTTKVSQAVPKTLHLVVDVETESGNAKTWGTGEIKRPEDRDFWRMEIREHRLKILDWAMKPGPSNRFVRFH